MRGGLVVSLLFIGGFSTVANSAITELESTFLQIPNPARTSTTLRYLTSVPHVAGTAEDFQMADFVSSEFNSYGIPVVDTFELDVLLNYPSFENPPRLDMTSGGDVVFSAKLSEDIEDSDSTSDTILRNHTYFGYGATGEVRGAQVVFANYGKPSDFDALESNGVSVEGKVVIVRYGGCFRGLKIMNAEARGAVGVLIYSDPEDDGFAYGPTYPAGPWRSETSVQRGSVQYNSICAGDPMRADPKYAEQGMDLESLCGISNYTDLIPKIPALPLSYGDAKPILELLGGDDASSIFPSFTGGLDMRYTIGPSDVLVNFNTDNPFKVTKIPNVVGKIPGTLSEEEDMPVLLGNHRDAWVYGAADPNSGTSSLLEVARGLGELVKTGWQPKRTIYLLSWSGEEFGLLGSTGWAELNFVLIKRASVYLNVDTVTSGDELTVSATPSLATLWKTVMEDLDGFAGFKGTPANGPRGTFIDANVNSPLDEDEIGTLGSGSDYTVFLDHFGIASLDFEYSSPAGTYGVYHSIYDSFDWITNFGGSEGEVGSSFEYMAGAAQIWGLLALRLADVPILPFHHKSQADALSKYSQFIEKQGSEVDLTNLNAAIKSYAASADIIATEIEEGAAEGNDINERLAFTERSFLSEGLPGRSWMKHILQAPGLYLGYAAEALPGIQQALDDGDLVVAQEQADVAAECISNAAAFLAGTPA